MVESFKQVFDEMSERNMLCWNITISRYLRCRRFEEALDVFRGMRCESNEKPDEATAVSTISACTALKNLGVGLVRQEKCFMGMYVQFNYTTILTRRAALFQEMQTKMLGDKFTAVALHRLCSVGSIRARGMDSQIDMKPDDFTFIVVLSACVHRGLVDEGREFFNSMRKIYERLHRSYSTMVARSTLLAMLDC
ncbi:hypothetical protein ACFX14_017722 [Malus domestica]